MNTQNLVTIFSGSIANEPEMLCNARDLHQTLQVGRDFSTWIKDRISEYGFVENQDYILIPQNGGIKTAGRGGDRRSKDYHITLDTAKELAMVEKNDMGRKVRRYFIQCEKELRASLSGSRPKQIAPKKSKTVPGGLTLEQVEQIQAMHKTLVGSVEKARQGALAVTLWSAIKAKFGCNYKEIPPEYFLDVLSLMSRTAADKNAQWQEQTPPPLNRKVFEQIAKVCAYANCWNDMQKLLCGKADSPQAQHIVNTAVQSTNLNQSGFLFVFRPDVENDVRFVADWLHKQSAYI